MSSTEFFRHARKTYIDRLGEERGLEEFEEFKRKFDKSAANARQRQAEHRQQKEKKKIRVITVAEATLAMSLNRTKK